MTSVELTFLPYPGGKKAAATILLLRPQDSGTYNAHMSIRRLSLPVIIADREIDVLRQLVQDLTQRGAILTVDALHTQKNAGAHRTGRSSLSGTGQG
jgi:hypothetical protein